MSALHSDSILHSLQYFSGQSGRMRMFLWDETNVSRTCNITSCSSLSFQPERDGALENDIVVHENTHGVTNRMTGGGTGRCLQTTEAGGMGEGEEVH